MTRLTPGRLAGVVLIDIEPVEDERGFFARSLCLRELAASGINFTLAQCSISYNRRQGTLRGLHYQATPHEEAKLVRCTAGAIYDVVVDIRETSPTYLQWEAFSLTAENRTTLYVPPGFAHGFQTLQDGSEVLYHISSFYVPGHARGLAWNDPALGITWPLKVAVISERDRCHPPVGR